MKSPDITIQSMTGFGQAIGTAGGFRIRIDIKSVNHRYAEVSVKIPREWISLEETIRKAVLSRIKRGRMDVFVTFERDFEAIDTRRVVIQWPLVKQYVEAAKQLAEHSGIGGSVTVQELLRIPEIVSIEEQESAEDESFQRSFLLLLDDAVKQLVEMRLKEGSHLQKDLLGRLKKLEQYLASIEEKSAQAVLTIRDRLRERIRSLLEGSGDFDEQRIMMEAAVLADKADIVEEITRLKSHLLHFYKLLETAEPVGRKLDFLVQEIHREINTIGSKTAQTDVVSDVIEMKSELERIREQVQNIQ